MTRFSYRLVANLSALVGSLALIAFFAFAIFGPLSVVDLKLGNIEIVCLDTLLSFVYFLQHSLMIRQSVRNRIEKAIPRETFFAFHSIASGIALIFVVLAWQESSYVVLSLSGQYRYLSAIPAAVSVLGLIWSVKSLTGFDIFGRRQIDRYINSKKEKEIDFVSKGPYKIVRHPFYFFILVMMWSHPVLSIDRLLFIALWTAWIFVGTVLEERDLVAQIGDDYKEYRKKVPMLIPYKIFG